jgi:hypothetical protein
VGSVIPYSILIYMLLLEEVTDASNVLTLLYSFESYDVFTN